MFSKLCLLSDLGCIQEGPEKRIEENPRIHEIFEYGGEIFYLAPDNHNNEHIKLSKNTTRDRLKNWNNTDATFNPECANYYSKIIKEVIIAVVKINNSSYFVRYGHSV